MHSLTFLLLAVALIATASPIERHSPSLETTGAGTKHVSRKHTGHNLSQGKNADTDPQTSLTLHAAAVHKSFLNDGQHPPTGKKPSLTSGNNFINYCLTSPNTPLTNGRQIIAGSCNAAPMGLIPRADKMPSAKFVYPMNMDTIPFNQTFTIRLALTNLAAGEDVNAQENYFSAPQQLDENGLIRGHTGVVIQQLESLNATKTMDLTVFSYYKRISTPLVDGEVSAEVSGGCSPGVYRLCSQTSAMNHQPVAVPVAQRGNVDDCVYFTAK